MCQEYDCKYSRQSISDMLDTITGDFPDPSTTERITVRAGEKFEAVDEIVSDVVIQLMHVMAAIWVERIRY